VPPDGVRSLRESGGGPGEGLAHDQVFDRLSERGEGCQGKLPDNGSQRRGLGRRGRRQEELTASNVDRVLGKSEPAADRSDGTVQSQLAADEAAVQSALR
jgi:hypothetical protein